MAVIKIKRGTQSQADSGSLLLGELGLATDTKHVFVGDGVSKIMVGKAIVDVISNRPSAAIAGRLFLASDENKLYVDTGSSWINTTGTGSSSSWSLKTGSYSASSGDKLNLDSSGGVFTITLPASPSAGDEIDFNDVGNYCNTNNITVSRNGNKINSLSEDLVINSDGVSFKLIYVNSTIGWDISSVA